MKTILLLIISMISLSLFGQQNGNSVFLFGTDSIQIKETDFGNYKKYSIEIIDPENGSTKHSKTFPLYNDETIEFTSRFVETYDSLEKKYKDSFLVKDEAPLKSEARIAYLRLRNIETVQELSSEDNIQPEAGIISVYDSVYVQQVHPQFKRMVKYSLKNKKNKLKKEEDSVKFLNFTFETNKWDTIIFKKKKENKHKYTKKFYNKPFQSPEYFKRKSHLKKEFLDLIVDSIRDDKQIRLNKLHLALKKSGNDINNYSAVLLQLRKDSLDLSLRIKEANQIINSLSRRQQDSINKAIVHKCDSLALIYTTNFPGLSGITNMFDKLKDTLILNNGLINESNNFKQNINNKIKKYRDTIGELTNSINALDHEIRLFNERLDEGQTENNENNFDLEILKVERKQKEQITNIYSDSLRMFQELSIEIHSLVTTRLKYNNMRTTYTITLSAYQGALNANVTRISHLPDSINSINDSISKSRQLYNNLSQQFTECKNNLILQQLSVDSLQIEFNDGAIENIQVIGKLNQTGDILKFSNLRPFGFTSKSDYDRLNRDWLFSENSNGFIYSLNVGKLIENYYEYLAVDRRDYSPRNQVIKIKRTNTHPPENKFKKAVYKEYSHEILTGTVFSDLNGISGNEPNGIIQTEFYKEMAIIKRRFSIKRPLYVTDMMNLNVTRKRDFNLGLASYLTPHFVISKIESNNKILELSSKEVTYNGVTDTVYYASTMDLRKYESFRVGIMANLLLLDFPTGKTTAYLDYSLYGGRIPTSKSVDEDGTAEAKILANSIEHGPLASIEFFTDERYGLRLSGGYNWYYVLNDDFTQTGDSRTFALNNDFTDTTKSKTGYWKFKFLAFLKPNRDGRGKIFFRYNFYAPANHWDLSWSQIQLGYAFSIMKTEAPAVQK
ncbi:MAG: hypothetical protein R2764_22205 [Bacteroidales bacterium]